MNSAEDINVGTASAAEVAQFAARADSWWDTEGDFAPLHRINPARLTFIRDNACSIFERDASGPRPLAGLRVLDLGCGGGLLSEPMARLGATVTGIDAAPENIDAAADHAAAGGLDITYRCALGEDLTREGAQFDIVLNMEVIEHVPDPAAFVAVCAELVAPGGLMFMATLNRTLKSLALGKVGAEYVLRWVPPGTHDWRKFVRPSELSGYLRRAGLDVSAICGLAYNLRRNEWELSRDLGVNYMAVARRWLN